MATGLPNPMMPWPPAALVQTLYLSFLPCAHNGKGAVQSGCIPYLLASVTTQSPRKGPPAQV